MKKHAFLTFAATLCPFAGMMIPNKAIFFQFPAKKFRGAHVTLQSSSRHFALFALPRW
jgi:hypothetical protein